MRPLRLENCPECAPSIDRRHFLRSSSGVALAAAVAPSLIGSSILAAPTPKSVAESVVAQFYSTLTDAQRQAICFPFEHELRSKISANWHITKPTISSDFYSKEQQALIDQIVKNVTSESGYERILKQTEYDDGGLGAYSVAVFGMPGSGKFQWELTGRHLTLRADGDSVPGAAFGGPIIYGHGQEDAKSNLYHYETLQAHSVFKSLDSKQAARALIAKAPVESAVPLQGEKGSFPGIAVSELTADQRQLVESTLKVLLSPYRQEDIDEVTAILKASGGVERLHMAFYQQDDLDDDKVWDIWRIEGPTMVWHFRGAPHVHAYIHIGMKTA